MLPIEQEYVQLARLVISGDRRDIASALRRGLHDIARLHPELASVARELLRRIPSEGPTRAAQPAQALPIDSETKLELLRRENVQDLPSDPAWPPDLALKLEAIVEERRHEEELLLAGVAPTRSLLFVGPPGVGKTFAARWLSMRLERPLLTLDLAAVMSSYLGRTGNNIRAVLDFARRSPCVLLLDEFDAIAKRRDDSSEVGELKRLVNVLLQAVDDWPATGLLIAATNHSELLDPAVWRRFDRLIVFPYPEAEQITRVLDRSYGAEGMSVSLRKVLSETLVGQSYSDVVRAIQNARRNAIVHGIDDEKSLLRAFSETLRSLDSKARIALATRLNRAGHSQRQVAELTGVSRDTVRRHRRSSERS